MSAKTRSRVIYPPLPSRQPARPCPVSRASRRCQPGQGSVCRACTVQGRLGGRLTWGCVVRALRGAPLAEEPLGRETARGASHLRAAAVIRHPCVPKEREGRVVQPPGPAAPHPGPRVVTGPEVRVPWPPLASEASGAGHSHGSGLGPSLTLPLRSPWGWCLEVRANWGPKGQGSHPRPSKRPSHPREQVSFHLLTGKPQPLCESFPP